MKPTALRFLVGLLTSGSLFLLAMGNGMRGGAAVPRAVLTADSTPARPRADHFATLEVYVDPHGTPMAAYQIEISPRAAPGGSVEFLSLSGGDPAAFREIPYFDPAAVNQPAPSMVIDALSTQRDLPADKTCICRIDVLYSGEVPKFSGVPIVVSSADAQKIDAAVMFKLIPARVR